MLLSRTSEYALRAMTVISQRRVDSPMSGQEIADEIIVPKPFLSKILRRLVVHGVLEATRGRRGGFQLARDASEITFLDILKAVGEDPGVEHCAFGWGKCNSKHPCPLHHAYSPVSSGFRTWASETTLDAVAPWDGSRPADEEPR